MFRTMKWLGTLTLAANLFAFGYLLAGTSPPETMLPEGVMVQTLEWVIPEGELPPVLPVQAADGGAYTREMSEAEAQSLASLLRELRAGTAAKTRPGNLSPEAQILGILDAFNKREIEEGLLVQGRAQDREVREFGERMYHEHRALMEELDRTVLETKITPAVTPDRQAVAREHEKTVQALREQAGEAFDRLYIQHERQSHEAVMQKLDEHLRGVHHPAVKQLVEKSRPVIQAHLESARSLDHSLNGRG